jgi:hypothetical protein
MHVALPKFVGVEVVRAFLKLQISTATSVSHYNTRQAPLDNLSKQPLRTSPPSPATVHLLNMYGYPGMSSDSLRRELC